MNDTNKQDTELFSSWSFGKRNYQIFGIGILTIIIGYVVMLLGDTDSVQSVKIAPWILIIGYCIIIPLSLLYRAKK